MQRRAAFILWLAMSWNAGADTFVREDIITDPNPKGFSVCHGGTCAIVTRASLDESQWAWITEVLAGRAPDAESERALIGETISRFEIVVGEMTGTADDRPENQFGKTWQGQMDCIDESTNTTTYLRMLVKAGLVRWHRVENRATRGWFFRGWPHTTAVVSDTRTGARWAVDSWFFENGRPPVIVPLELWKNKGWRPAQPPERMRVP